MKKGFDEEYFENQIEHEKRNLLFYALLYDQLVDKLSEEYIHTRINFHLDRLITFMRERDKQKKDRI